MNSRLRDWLAREGRSRWIQRVGPLPFLFVSLGLVTLLFVGCLQLGNTRPEPGVSKEPLPPVIVDRQIRVRLLGRKPVPSVQVAVSCPFMILDGRTGQQLIESKAALPYSAARPGPQSGISLADRVLDQDDIILSPQRDASITVNDKAYRGRLRIQSGPGGLTLTNQVDLESYLRGVLRGELPRSFHYEAFKAQAVAARTYALYTKRNMPPDRHFDVYDDEGSQMYVGVSGEDRIAVEAVEATHGEVCVWNNNGREEIFCTYYSSTCGGCTQSVGAYKPTEPAIPPLAGGVICPDCYMSPQFRWGPVRISKDDVTRRIVSRYPTTSRLGQIVRLEPKDVTADGRVYRILLVGSGGQNETLVGEDFRLCMGGRVLKSTHFTLDADPDAFVFRDGLGFGHGVGLCQYGMDTKASRGMTYKQILAAYYPQSTVVKLY